MPIDFPSSPTTGQKYTYNNITYTFTGKTWTASASNVTQLDSPTLTGTPTAPTPPNATNTQQVATTQFVQSVLAAAIAAIPPPPPQFPAGTLMVFQQTATPPTWTKDTTHNDKSLRVVNGAAASGGVQPFSTAFGRTAVDNTTLDGNTLPAHAHGVADPTHGHGLGDPTHGHGIGDPTHAHTGQGFAYNTGLGTNGGDQYYNVPVLGDVGTSGAYTGIWTGGAGTGQWVGGAGTGISIYNAGGSVGHSHGIDIRVLYVDIIIGRKD
jgi:hypothetical protein